MGGLDRAAKIAGSLARNPDLVGFHQGTPKVYFFSCISHIFHEDDLLEIAEHWEIIEDPMIADLLSPEYASEPQESQLASRYSSVELKEVELLSRSVGVKCDGGVEVLVPFSQVACAYGYLPEDLYPEAKKEEQEKEIGIYFMSEMKFSTAQPAGRDSPAIANVVSGAVHSEEKDHSTID
ncbi:hypothetical protein ACH5RR_029448 [Cinchona calisaya]|uniref:Uncharacterized protein n=1 Tax=Cinchona calisaya TaxID=153742 RepID=A0ABD2YW46_9GENT